MNHQPDMDMVITSCGRFDLLEATLNSFFKYNDYPIKQYIIVDDSGLATAHQTLKEICSNFEGEFILLVNEQNIGQVPSIDLAYEKVRAEYVFHCEDDWEFYAAGFISKSLDILEQAPDIVNVWLRAHDDTMNHPICFNEMRSLSDGTSYYLMCLAYREVWHGFTLNPSVKRMADLRKLLPFNKLSVVVPKRRKKANLIGEADLSIYFKEHGYRAAITTNTSGYLRHIGDNAHIRLPWESRFKHISRAWRASIKNAFKALFE